LIPPLRRHCLAVLLGLLCWLLPLALPNAAVACVPGLDWGMQRSHLEDRLGVSLTEAGDRTLEAHGLTIGELPVTRLRLQLSDGGLQQLAYELEPDAMTEVLAGLRSRYGAPVSTTVETEGQPMQQVWVWNTGTDCITAVRAGDEAFLLSYRPSRLNPALL
jgi:hypothetical protein